MSVGPLPDFGRRLWRLRRMRGLKQAAVAQIADVCQATVSRWESGSIAPDVEAAERILGQLTRGTGLSSDSALRSLVESSRKALHLVTDFDHRLLAASPSREVEWRKPATQLAGQSLWRYATPEIEDAEKRLERCGWWRNSEAQRVSVQLQAGDTGLHIKPGLMVWERLYLADGTPVRLCISQ